MLSITHHPRVTTIGPHWGRDKRGSNYRSRVVSVDDAIKEGDYAIQLIQDAYIYYCVCNLVYAGVASQLG